MSLSDLFEPNGHRVFVRDLTVQGKLTVMGSSAQFEPDPVQTYPKPHPLPGTPAELERMEDASLCAALDTSGHFVSKTLYDGEFAPKVSTPTGQPVGSGAMLFVRCGELVTCHFTVSAACLSSGINELELELPVEPRPFSGGAFDLLGTATVSTPGTAKISAKAGGRSAVVAVNSMCAGICDVCGSFAYKAAPQ